MTAVYALYPDPDSAQRAVHELRKAGVAEESIEVVSSEPFEEHDFAHRDKATWMFWLSGLGGLIGLATGTFLTWYTETAWPLPTGGMPIVSWWPNLVIMFELTMLGAILAAVITLIVSAGLGRRRSKLYDREIMEGRILVGVEHPRVSRDAVERALRAVPGARVKAL